MNFSLIGYLQSQEPRNACAPKIRPKHARVSARAVGGVCDSENFEKVGCLQPVKNGRAKCFVVTVAHRACQAQEDLSFLSLLSKGCSVLRRAKTARKFLTGNKSCLHRPSSVILTPWALLVSWVCCRHCSFASGSLSLSCACVCVVWGVDYLLLNRLMVNS